VLENRSQSNKPIGVIGFIVLTFFICMEDFPAIKSTPARIESTL
jgi:hypothetical protein